MKNLKKGFTLVEMLIVIAIIAILVMFIVVSIRESQIRSRDARRIAEVNQIGKALQAYKSAIGNYPNPTRSDCSVGAISWERGNMADPVANNFIQPLVLDGIVAAGGVPKEKSLPISACTYGYTHVELSNCGGCNGSYGVLYAKCEGNTCPTGEKTCCKGDPAWPQGESATDNGDMIYFFKE